MSSAWRLSFYFGALFAVVGVQMPYWPIFLQSKQLTAADIGLVLSAALWVKVIANPLIAQWSDRRGLRRLPMICLCLAAIAAYVMFFWAEGLLFLILVSIVAGVAIAAIMPLGENVALVTANREGLDYGRMRLWGSLTFIVASIGLAPLLRPLGPGIILWAILGLLLVTLLTCRMLPDVRPPRAERGAAPLFGLLRRPVFLLFLAAISALQASHAVLYAFGTLHWRDSGVSDGVIGFLWAEGVVAEIVLFWLGAGLLRRIGVSGMLVLAGLAGAVRWTAYGLSSDIGTLLVMQTLHAFTFGAAHLGAMHFIARAAPPAWSATAQSLYTAVSGGIALGLGILVAGLLYENFKAGAFFLSAALSLLGVLCAILLKRHWDGRPLPT
jgi:PPP family 3-phenylpropionic acid transporter